jgi:hypothetical protein
MTILTTDNIVLSYHLNKDLQWTVSTAIFSDNDTDNLINLDYTTFFNDVETYMHNMYNSNFFVNAFADEPDGCVTGSFVSYLKNHKLSPYQDANDIEGGWEIYAKNGNFGIFAFPGKQEPGKDYDYITDDNNIDSYRFLYLWRTYSYSYGKKYKIILK